MMKLYGRSTAFNVMKVLWLLDELKLTYEHIQAGGKYGGLDTEEFATLNPMKKIPVLIEDEKSVWESHTILRYLVAKHGGEAWWNPDPFERSLCERWMDWSQVTFQGAFMNVFWGYYRMPPEKRDPDFINRGMEACHSCLSQLDIQLDGKQYLTGDTISLADIPAGAVLYRLTEMGLDIKLPENVSRWYQQLKARPAYQKRIMSDFSELKGREDF